MPPSDWVRRHAARSPEAPWLFWPRGGWDWAWLSWAEGLQRLASPFAAGELAPHEAFLRSLAQAGEEPSPPGFFSIAEREVVVAHRSWDDPDGRRLLTWAVATGAAILFDPFPASYVATAAWVRPTLFQGTAAEITALRRAAEAYRPPWPRRRGRGLPFGRLHTVWAIGASELEEGERIQWMDRGVRVVTATASRRERDLGDPRPPAPPPSA